MAKNRKNQSAAVRFGPALKAFLLCLIFGGSGIGYVWQKQQINELGRELRRKEQQFDQLRRQNESYSRVLAQMESPSELDARVRQLNLGLVPPHPDQIVRLPDVWQPATAPGGRKLFAAETKPPSNTAQ